MTSIVANDGTKLHVNDWGTGRPVVLVHGWPLNADSWEYQARPIAEAGYRVIAYDRRGFGRSDQPFQGYDYDTLADDLKAVMEGLGLSDAALFGFSMGGGEVARYMSRHSGAGVRQAGLISSVAPYMLKAPDNPDGVDPSVFEEMKDGIKADRPGFLQDFFKQFYGTGLLSHPVSDGILHWSWAMAMMASPKATLDCIDAFGKTDFRPDMAAFTMPTLVVHGTGDATVPIDTSGRAAATAIAQAELKEYDGAPHGLTITNAEQLTQDMLAFLNN